MTNKIEEAIGWYGAGAIILAYALNSFSLIENTGIPYQLLNLTGAMGIAFISFKKKTYQPGVLNTIWMGIAAIALLKIIL